MRIVHEKKELETAIQSAKREAAAAFGDDELLIEKYFPSARHIEFQIFGDQHGNAIHLLERECTIQRRYQKIIEESPSPVLSTAMRQKMGEAAVKAAQAIQYDNAGTVEFIYINEDSFYFLEVNTRLQVEHPVTEQITGLDLVKLQIKIAEGEELPFKQEELSIKGHAIEVRVYAEDPANNFLPDIGTLKTYNRPQGHGIRVDDGFEEGMSIPFYYDPMIAKMICSAHTREEAIEKMIRAIDEYEITGVETTLGFCKFVMQHEAFRSGHFDTKFVENYFKPEVLNPKPDEKEELLAALLASTVFSSNKSVEIIPLHKEPTSKWRKNRV
jgi:propionyl-CoA carboxylase alpha chain